MPALAPEAAGVLALSVGAALIKTFRHGATEVRTGALLHQATGWKGYVWNAAVANAVLALAVADLTAQTDGGSLAYHVPYAHQCKACHIGPDKSTTPMGPKLRNRNFPDN